MKDFRAADKSHAGGDEKHDINFHWPNAFPTLSYILFKLDYASNLYFVNSELKISPVTICDSPTLCRFNYLLQLHVILTKPNNVQHCAQTFSSPIKERT